MRPERKAEGQKGRSAERQKGTIRGGQNRSGTDDHPNTVGAMPTCPTIETERLILRPLVEADLADYTAVMTHPAVRASLHLPDTFGEHQAWDQMVAFAGQWALRGTGQWALEEKTTGRFIGRAGTHAPHRDDWPGVEVGWTVHPDHWGKGYASEAGQASVDWAFGTRDPHIEQLHSMILTANVRSQAVARRLGFELAETRTYRWFPALPHGRWHLPRERWLGQRAERK